MAARTTLKLGFLIFPGFPMACLTSMIEPLRAANEILGDDVFGWHLISETGSRIISSAQVAFDPDHALRDVEGLDLLIVLSAPASTLETPDQTLAQLRHLDRHGTMLGGVSGGIFPMARAGLLEGQKVSVHWCYETAFATEFPELDASDDVIVLNGRRVTISGAAAAFEFAIQMIEERLGADLGTEVACWFQHPIVRREGVRQSVPTLQTTSTDDMLPETVRQGVALFADHIEIPISVAEVADRLGVSPKQLERKFKKATGQSPKQYYRTMRMKAARQLVIYSKDSMASIALSVGYSSASPMLAHYKATFGLSPQEDRQRINLYRVQDNISVPSA